MLSEGINQRAHFRGESERLAKSRTPEGGESVRESFQLVPVSEREAHMLLATRSPVHEGSRAIGADMPTLTVAGSGGWLKPFTAVVAVGSIIVGGVVWGVQKAASWAASTIYQPFADVAGEAVASAAPALATEPTGTGWALLIIGGVVVAVIYLFRDRSSGGGSSGETDSGIRTDNSSHDDGMGVVFDF